jgi:hypothetical protein
MTKRRTARLCADVVRPCVLGQIMELYVAGQGRSPLDAVSGAVKAALTRDYNKGSHATSTVTWTRIGAKGRQDDGGTARRAAAAAGGDVATVDEDGADASDASESEADSDADVGQFTVAKKAKRAAAPKKAAAPRRRAAARR